MSTKKKPPAPGAGGAAGQGLNLGAFLKAQGMSPYAPAPTTVGGRAAVNAVGTDYSKLTLQYTPLMPDGTYGVPRAPKDGTEFALAINQINDYPALQAALHTKFELGSSFTSKQADNAWKSVESSKYDLVSALSPTLAQAVNALKIATDAQANTRLATQYSATVSQQANAIDNISATLNSWNYTPAQLKHMGDVLRQLVTTDGSHMINQNALLQVFRGEAPSGLGKNVDASIKTSYEAAFPGLNDYNNSPGAVHMNESQYQAYSTKIQDTATQYGAPMPDKTAIGELLKGNVSPAEYNQRVTDIYATVTNANQNVRNQLEQQYGIKAGDLVHYMMDPKNALPAMQRKVAAAELGDYATRVGLKGLTSDQTTELADAAKLAATAGNSNLGYGVNQIQGALLGASKGEALTTSAPGANQPTVSATQLIGSQLAGFGGTNQAAEQVQVGRAEQARTAQFEKGGGFVETSKGVVGVGSART